MNKEEVKYGAGEWIFAGIVGFIMFAGLMWLVRDCP